jgi:hypothetical protein
LRHALKCFSHFLQNTGVLFICKPLSSLRHSFGKGLDNNSFDIDDSLIFLKSLMPFVIETVKEVFSNNGILIQSFEDILIGIQSNIASQSINLTAIDSTFVGVNIGGSNNRASGKN